jgi:hypothetical protein
MKPTDKIEARIRKYEIETNAGKDNAFLNSLLTAQAQSHCGTSGLGRTAVKAGIVAVAAGIVLVSLLWLSGLCGTRRPSPVRSLNTAASNPQASSGMITAMSLNTAFYRGGMEAVEKQFEQAEKKEMHKSYEQVTREQLMCELLGGC